MAVVNLGGSGTIYDPNLPQRAQQQPAAPQNAPMMPNTDQVDAPSAQQDNFPVPMDPGIAAMLARAATPQNQTQQQIAPTGGGIGSDVRYPLTPWTDPMRNAPTSGGIGGDWRFTSQQVDPRLLPAPAVAPAPQSVRGNYLNRSLGNVDARGAPYPMAARGGSVGAPGSLTDNTFNGLTDDMIVGKNAVQSAQAPAPATPQGWNLFTALGQALGHLLGYNASGQPQGMSGLIRNPVQTPTQTPGLRMPTPVQQAARYQGRTLIG
jgi:hypothetical protein